MKKTRMTRKTKDEKRRLAFEKRNVKKEINLARYGAEGGSALVMAKTTDFNRRFVAAFMALVFAISCIVIGINFAARADDPVPAQTSDDNSNLVLEKTLSAEPNGTYTLQLSAYAKGKIKDVNEQIPTDYVLIADQSGSMSTNDVPTGYNNGETKNWKVSDGANAYYYKETDSDGVDHYYRVYRKYGDMFEYHARDTVYSGSCVDNLSWFQRESDQDLGKASQYYYNPSLDNSGSRVGSATDNRFYPVTVSAKGGVGYYGIRFRFTDVNGTSDYLRYPDQPYYKSPTGGLFGPGDRWGLLFGYDLCNSTCKGLTGNDSTQYTYGSFLRINTGMYVRQVLFSRHVDYSQLAYRDDNGVEHLLIDATYCNSSGTPVGGSCGANGAPSQNYTSTTEAYWNGTLYSASGTTTRLNALKAAMTEFIGVVSNQQNEDGTQPDHRVAIVGFTSLSGTGSANTELLTGINLNTSASNKTGVRYNNITSQQYKEALLDVTNAEQLAKLNNAVQALDASGGTEGQYGLYMAKNILDQRELTKFTTKGGEEVDRLTIIVYFTDGTPGNYEDDNQYSYGNEVIDAAYQIKTDSQIPNAEIYSIGTFGFADSEPLVYEKYTGNNSEYKFDPDYVKTLPGTWTSGYMYRIWLRNTQGYGDVATDTVYDYMRTITTEFPNATQFVDPSWYGTGTKSDNGVYTDMVSRVRRDSNGNRRYFLCTDLSALSRVFTTIGSEETEAGTEIELNETNSYLQDVLSDNFEKTDDTKVTAQTYYGWMDTDTATEPRWGTTVIDPINQWSWSLDKKTLTVEGFNYTENYIAYGKNAGTPVANRGKKLVVTITNLKPTANAKSNGLSDPNLPTNGENSGIFQKGETATDDRKIDLFDSPTIQRYEYKLNAEDCSDTSFDVNYTLQKNDGSPASEAIVIRDSTTATRFDQLTDNTFTSKETDGSSVYVEYITNYGKSQTADPTDYTLLAEVTPTDTSERYTYYLGTEGYPEQSDSNQLPKEEEIELSSTPSDVNAFYINRKDNNRIVTIHLDAEESPYVDTNYEFKVDITLSGNNIADKLNSVTTDNPNIGFTADGTNTLKATITMPYKADGTIDPVDIKVPDGAVLSVSHSDYFYTTDPIKYTDTDVTSQTEYTAHAINQATNIYINDVHRDNVGEGIAEDSNPMAIVMYALGGIFVISVAGTGAYIYRRKREER